MIDQYVKNQGQNVTKCEKVVGNKSAVHALGNISSAQADLIQIMQIHEQAEWLGIDKSGTYSSNEMKAFRQGLHAIPLFMNKCYEEMLLEQETNDNL